MVKKPVWRTISKEKYITAGIITLLIFFLGITFGLVIENHRYDLTQEVNEELEVKYLSLQLQHLYLNSFSNQDNCPILATALKETVKDLSDSLSEVIAYEEENDASNKRKDLVIRRYTLDNLRYWLLAIQSKKQCNINLVPVLYFYSTDCPSCPNQGTIFTYFKQLFGEEILVFPINLDYRDQEPMIEIMVSQYEINKFPTSIIDNKKYEGVLGRERLQKIICKSLQDSEHCNK